MPPSRATVEELLTATAERPGELMKLTYIYQPITALDDAVAYYRGLGFEEAWEDGETTVAFWLPDRSVQLMLSTTVQPSGPMYLVESLDAWIDEHPSAQITVPAYEIPDGSVAGFEAPGGNTFYVYDQPGA